MYIIFAIVKVQMTVQVTDLHPYWNRHTRYYQNKPLKKTRVNYTGFVQAILMLAGLYILIGVLPAAGSAAYGV